MAFNIKERTEAEYNSISATSSKLARQQLKLARFTMVRLDVHHDDIPVPEGFHNLVEFSSESLIDSTDPNENPLKNARVPPPPILDVEENSQIKKVQFQDQSEILNPRKENTNQR